MGEYVVDVGPLRELREHEKQAAEKGNWQIGTFGANGRSIVHGEVPMAEESPYLENRISRAPPRPERLRAAIDEIALEIAETLDLDEAVQAVLGIAETALGADAATP